MANYLKVQDAEYIRKFARRMESRWAAQEKVDTRAAGLYTKQASVSVATQGDNQDVVAVSGGIAGQGIDQDVALITVFPFLRVNNPDPKDEDLKKRIDSLVEPWLAAVRKRSQIGPVEERAIADLPLFGRSWTNLFPLPRLWADSPKFQDLLKQYQDLVSDGGDEKNITEARKALELFRRDHFPIRWRYVNPRSTWYQHSDEVHLPEVIEIRTMTAADILSNYNEEDLPDGFSDGDDEREVKVYTYTNHVQTATTVDDGGDPHLVHDFEHGMGLNPYILSETKPYYDNPLGIRWVGSLFHISDQIELFDQLMSDYATNHRMNAITPRIWEHLPDDTDPQTLGRPDPDQLTPGQDVHIWAGLEKVYLAPVPQIQQQAIQLLQEVKERINSAFLQPHLGGESKSGESNVLFNTRFQVSDRQFQGKVRAIGDAAEQFGELAFRCVKALNDKVPDTDKVYALSERHGWLGLSPKDVDGLEGCVQARIDRELPINMTAKVQRAQMLKEFGLPMSLILESVLNYENPEDIMDQAFVERAVAASEEAAIQQVWAQANFIIQQAAQGNAGGLSDRVAALPPAFQQGLQLAGAPGMGGMGQSMGNMAREGSPQAPTQFSAGQMMGGA